MPVFGRVRDAGSRAARRWSLRWLAVLGGLALALAATAAAVGATYDGPRDGQHDSAYRQLNLVSDIPGVARITDPNLVNPWGVAAGPTTPIWVSDNATDLSTLYAGGIDGSIPQILPLVVRIPLGKPTGMVFNKTDGFVVHGSGESAPALFIFSSLTGAITGWSPNVPTADEAHLAVNRPGSVYTGLAILGSGPAVRLYAADFANARIDVFDDQFADVSTPGAFVDPDLPDGYAPFNIQDIGNKLYVAYAKQEEGGGEEEAGPGLGYVDVYDGAGHLLKRLASQGPLNAPWGLARAPRSFGSFGGDLLVGNFGDGRVNAYNPRSGSFEGTLANEDGNPIAIDGLWALRFGNGVTGMPDTLLFTAGIGDEEHGLFGAIVPAG